MRTHNNTSDTSTTANTRPATADIEQLQREFDLAELHADRRRLEELIDDDFISIGPKGYLMDKTQWIARHDFFSYQKLDTTERDVRTFESAAIVRNVQRNHATSSGRQVRVEARVGQTWVRRVDTWRLVGIQFSPLAADD